MDTREKLIAVRIGMLALADELKNISRTCQIAGISRTYYTTSRTHSSAMGATAWRLASGAGRGCQTRPRPSWWPASCDGRVPDLQLRAVSQQLRLIGVPASAAQVRGVWAREGLLKRFDRLLWLERQVAERGGPLTKSVLKLLRQHAHQTTDPQQTSEAPVPGFLVYEAQGVPLQRVLTDNGREYCGRPLRHAHQLYCGVQQVEHRTTRIGSPESNGMVERFNRMLKEEFFNVAYRKRL